MHVITTRVDIERTRAGWTSGDFLPAYVFPRRDTEVWQVLDAPYNSGQLPSFASTAADEYIRIPLFPYTLNPTGDIALAFMLKFGLSFVGHISHKIKLLHIVTGNPVELVYNEKTLTHMRYWVGFAFVLEKD